METAGAWMMKICELMKENGIGRPTSQYYWNAFRRQYIVRNKNKVLPTPTGFSLLIRFKMIWCQLNWRVRGKAVERYWKGTLVLVPLSIIWKNGRTLCAQWNQTRQYFACGSIQKNVK
jgi:hypothetical protein